MSGTIIDVEDLTYTYAGAGAPAVKGCTFHLEAGDILGFLGPSGAGKSTTQKILIGLLRGYQGRVSVLDRELDAWGPEYYEQVGVAFEQPNHYLKLTAFENLKYFASLYGGSTDDPAYLLDLVGLGSEGHKRVGEYSKGMRGRLSVARALVNRPKLLFLDEPTSGLDPVNSRRIRDLILARRAEGATVFLTTHNMAVADELCDRVAFLVDGRIALIDSPRALRLQYGRRSVRVEYAVDGRLDAAEFPLDGLGENDRFLDVLRHGDVQTIHTQETTLEDIFIQVTGRPLT